MFVRLITGICAPNQLKSIGHSICTPPPVSKSPKRECWTRAATYGRLLHLYFMNAGRRIIAETMRECVAPRCVSPGISKSKSGKIETRKSRGMFTLTFRSLDVAFPVKYPKARCPTANVNFFPQVMPQTRQHDIESIS